jgi:hypothetical protein
LPAVLDRALARLEMKARDSGVARGMFLVPITMVAIEAKPS